MIEFIKSLPERIKNRILLDYYVRPFAKRNSSRKATPENTICLFCQSRSGSSWLAEMLSCVEKSYVVSEPLWRGPIAEINKMPLQDLRKIPEIAFLDFYFFQPILENEQWPEAKELFHKIITGQTGELGLYRFGNILNLSSSEIYIIKFNFGQLLMHWLVNQFNFKSILLIRHPCAVVNSQIKFKYFNKIKIEQLPTCIPFFRNHTVFTQYEDLYKNFCSIEEWLAFFWAIQVKNSLHHPKNNIEWLTVGYEKLVLDFENEIARIFHYLGRKIPDKIFDIKNIPSISTATTSIGKIENNAQLYSWTKTLSTYQIKLILDVVEAVGVSLYDSKIEPNYDMLYRQY